jgi:hypothetical protein
MRNEDVEELFEIVTEGTVVHIEGPITGIGKGELKNLSLGSKGNLVQIIQERLKLIGFYNGKVNGIYDKETERAVKSFQKVHNLSITGGVTKREYILLGIFRINCLSFFLILYSATNECTKGDTYHEGISMVLYDSNKHELQL